LDKIERRRADKEQKKIRGEGMYACLFCLFHFSDEQSLDLTLDSFDLFLEFFGFVGGNGASDDGSSDATGPTERSFGRDEHVGHVLL
jgi:hypothetical protein